MYFTLILDHDDPHDGDNKRLTRLTHGIEANTPYDISIFASEFGRDSEVVWWPEILTPGGHSTLFGRFPFVYGHGSKLLLSSQ